MPVTLSYWPGIRGKAELVRFILDYAGVEFDEQHQDFTNAKGWHLEKKVELAKAYPFINLPYLKFEDGQILSCQAAIVAHLARKYDLYGDGSDQVIQNIQMAQDVMSDMFTAFFQNVMPNPKGHEKWNMYNQMLGAKFLAPLEANAKNQAGTYLCGTETITVADLHFLNSISLLEKWKPAILDEFPTLKAVYAKLLETPKLAARKAIEDKLPVTIQYKNLAGMQVGESKNHPMIQKRLGSLPELHWGCEGRME